MELQCGLASEIRRDRGEKESEMAFFRHWESFQKFLILPRRAQSERARELSKSLPLE